MSRTFRMAPVASAMAQIADGGMVPITKQPTKATPADSRVNARDFVCSFFEHMEGQEDYWKNTARVIMDGAVDFRIAVMDEIAAQNAMLKTAEHPRAASFRVQASKMNTICRAWIAGASVEGLLAAHSDKGITWDDMSFNTHIIKYAQAFLESKGQADQRGRKADSFKVALKKFLDKRSESLASDTDKVNHARVLAFLEQLQD